MALSFTWLDIQTWVLYGIIVCQYLLLIVFGAWFKEPRKIFSSANEHGGFYAYLDNNGGIGNNNRFYSISSLNFRNICCSLTFLKHALLILIPASQKYMFLKMAEMWVVLLASLNNNPENSDYDTADLETKTIASAAYIFLGISLGMMATYCIIDKFETR